MTHHRGEGTVVEFVGVPGAGKSTLARRLGERLRADGLSVAEPTYRLAHEVTAARRYFTKTKYATRAAAVDPSRAVSIGQLVAATAQPTRQALVKTTFNWLYVHGVLTAIGSDGWVVLDQGPCQAAWSVALGAGRDRVPTLCEAAVASLARAGSALVVFVDVDPETVRDRLTTRSADDTRVSTTGNGHTIEAAFDVTTRVERSVANAATRYPSVNVVRVENESPSDLDTGVATIRTALGVDSG